MKKLHWVHAESGCAGYVLTERALEVTMMGDPCVEHVSEACFNTWVADGCEVTNYSPLWLIPNKKREQLYERAKKLAFKLESFSAVFQNDGMCMQRSHTTLLAIKKEIEDELNAMVKEAVNSCEEIR